jgi:tripartite-type tricarboxylate transporter receptor subunit TctC
MAPAGTPAVVVDKLHAALVEVLAMPDVKQRMVDAGLDVAPSTPAEFAKKVKDDLAQWHRAVTNANLQ